MTPERWQRIQEILDLAVEAPRERRQEIVAAACEGDLNLQQEVENLLDATDEVGDFIEDPLWNLNDPGQGPGSPNIPDQIGHFRIERLLGRGGMGDVFLASREGDYSQRVAIKVVREGYRADALSRFYNERQILANLQHPEIARLLDGGALPDGRPYFVMEFVEGEPIDQYCTRHGLSIRERIELFNRVCAVVHFAHQNLVVHRDLKASNILVTPEGRPRLLDFGIAKLLETGKVSNASLTASGLVPMTPANASPEQLLDEPITTACDIYALALLLYRLLAGRPPYRLEGQGFAEMVQVICLSEPKRPSEAALEEDPLATPPEMDPKRRAVNPEAEKKWLHRSLVGDLDAIVMKAMRKEPSLRYGSAAGMAEDLRRYLKGLPVLARKGTWLYNASKFVRRNKWLVAMLLLVTIFSINTTRLWLDARRERAQAEMQRERAETERERAVQVREFLINLFTATRPDAAGGQDLSAWEILEQGTIQAEEGLAGDPETQVEVWGTLGIVYSEWGLYEKALELKEKALRTRREFRSEEDVELATLINNVAKAYGELRQYDKAEGFFREVLAIQQHLDEEPSTITRAMNNLSNPLIRQGKMQEAERLLQESLLMSEKLGGPDGHRHQILSLQSLAVIHNNLSNFQTAESLSRKALAVHAGQDNPKLTRRASLLGTLGQSLHGLDQLGQAREAFEESLSIRQKILGSEHPKVAKAELKLAALLVDLGQTKRAKEMIEHSLQVLLQSIPEDDWEIAVARSIRGHCLVLEGRFEEAGPLLTESHQLLSETLGKNNSFTRSAKERLDLLPPRLPAAAP